MPANVSALHLHSRHFRLSAMLSNIGDPLENQCRRRFQHCEAIIAQALSKEIRIFLKAIKSGRNASCRNFSVPSSRRRCCYYAIALCCRGYLSGVAMPVRMA
jgi:hypothetical protein